LTFTQSIEDVLLTLRATVRSGVTGTLQWRRQQLRELRRLVVEGEPVLKDALAADLGKSPVESWLTDLATITSEIDFALAHLRAWMRPERVPVPLAQLPARARIVRQPLGVVAVIAPWNYPVNLTLTPAVGAIAAGNTVVVKPSELAPATSRALAELTANRIDPGVIAVVEGGASVAEAIIDARVDHVLYTGGPSAARAVMAAASRHLTPVTLELGGKNPAIVCADTDLRVAARRVAWGRFLNAGQTCVAPDYVLVEAAAEERFVGYLVQAIGELFDGDPKTSAAYARIVDEHHFDRLTAMLEGHGGDLVAGGDFDRADLYLAPTLVRAPDPLSALMDGEIFGPILVIDAVTGVDEALARIGAHPDPLALYLFTSSRERADDVIHRTRSGGVGVNTTVLQVAIPGLPFGGIGASGTGAYHGRAGFERFSHARAVLEKSTRLDLPVLYPPYRSWKDRLMRRAQRWRPTKT
jgi:aldehyde dehydrogenase (NAD+)